MGGPPVMFESLHVPLASLNQRSFGLSVTRHTKKKKKKKKNRGSFGDEVLEMEVFRDSVTYTQLS